MTDVDNTPLRRRTDLVAAGFTDHELRRGVRTGDLAKVRRGTYVLDPTPCDDVHRHRQLVHATYPELAPGTVVSHTSAAVLHGLPVWALPLDRVQVTKVRAYGGRRRGHLHVRVAGLTDDEVQCIDGLLATTVARTIVDLARAMPFEPAVALGDAALAGELTDHDQLVRMLRSAPRRPGCARARRVVGFIDGRAESIGESRSRVAIARAGLPPPHLQWEVRSDGGFVARTDFCWPEHGVVGEFDGRIKYGRLLRPGESAADAVYREKLREDAVRASGYQVERWGWSDLSAFDGVARRIRARLNH